jgi:hypothetical protein
MPGVKIPSFPLGGATLTGLRIRYSPVVIEMLNTIRCARRQLAAKRKLRVIFRGLDLFVVRSEIAANRRGKRFVTNDS